MTRTADSAQSRRALLYIAGSPRDAWEGALRVWFDAARLNAWQRAFPSVVLVPTRSHAHALKAKLLEEGWSHLGLHFLTPFALRTLLRPQPLKAAGESAHLRLLLAAAAEKTACGSSEPASRSIARAPDALLRTLDRIEAAGWRFEDLQYRSLEPLVRQFREMLHACGFALPATLDRTAAADANKMPARIGNLLITGFDGAHWLLWFLLQAAVQSAETATVVLHDARDAARDLDETWIGTWEELHGAAEFTYQRPPRGETLFPELFEPELFRASSAASQVAKHFLVGRDVSEQAHAVVALIETFLASGKAERIGVLFPAAGALPRVVATLLCAADISHNDGIGHLTPGPLEDDAWPLWLELQETPRVRVLLRFLRASPAACTFFGGLDAERIDGILSRAARNLLLDDLKLLRAYCATSLRSDKAERVIVGLDAISLLPEEATLTAFLEQTIRIFDSLDWRERRLHLEQASAGWAGRLTSAISRSTYLRWLAEISTSILPERDRNGDHPYSRVHLLLPAHAEGQTWSHLIFAGLNEGSWPARSNESGFVDELEIAEFNKTVRRLNRSAQQQGSQGEGHSIIADGRTFYLGPVEQRELAERQFQSLCESATIAIGASASLIEESAPERFANPSEFFTRLYVDANGEAPGQHVMTALAERTAKWLARGDDTPWPNDDPDVLQTAVAYRARRTPEVEFGEYEFALREPVERELVLSATDCERIIKAPALVWLRKFLGVEAREEDLANWNIAIGQWVHDWLRQVAESDGEFVQRPSASDVRDRVRSAAQRFRDETAALLGRRLPDWWISGWNQAAFIADALAETITTTEDWSHFATEWTLAPVAIRVSDTQQLRVRGRIDLLLAREATDAEGFPFREAWIIDYKTGRRTSLAPGRKAKDHAADLRQKLLEGKGVQLAVYALALHALGAEEVGASLLTRELDLAKPQVCLPEIEAQHDAWRDFARLGESGVFGMRGALRAEFGFQKDYPLATLGFDPDFLEEKWAKTYPGLPKIEKNK
ncbi:MAG: PD-(D/E)XK nuclease family protein [Verrucomicrobiota bacterium]|nr:PD-(D/E)XK nuclease family protein [Verrucomicrobiota bacterium]